MSVISISTPFNIDLEFNIASFGKRFLAWLIDFLIQLAYYLAYIFVVHENLPEDDTTRVVCGILFLALPILLYHFLLEVFFSGQSIGKKVMGIRVVNIKGNEASISQYLIRLLFRSFGLVPLVVFVFMDILQGSLDDSGRVVMVMTFLGLAMVGMFLFYILSQYGQRLGDRLANTLVIENKARADFHKTIYLEIADEAYQVRYPEVMRLTDRDINGIRNLLDVKRITKENEAYMARIAGRITEVLHITTNQEPYDFLAQLLRDYNFLTRK